MRVALEVVVATVADAIAAEAGGADRLELVANLNEGGITPSAGVIMAVRRATKLPLYVMIRPRGGAFVFCAAEVEAMVTDARIVRELGADGLVVGALTPFGAIEAEAVRCVLQVGRLPATFHRAFDELPDKPTALSQVAALPYVERVLTSGGNGRPGEAIAGLRDLVQQGSGIEVMAGAGVTLENASFILQQTGVRALHTATAVREPQTPTAGVSAERVRQMRRILDGGV